MDAKILFVDDEPNVTIALSMMLRKQPWELRTAASGAEALQTLESWPADVVISDIDMPGMGGVELLSKLRTAHPRTMRIALSGRASVEHTIRAINDAAIFRFLQKPCPAAELIQCIQEALALRTRRNSGEIRSVSSRFDQALKSLWMATQPIVSMRERKVVAYEALVRTREPSFPHGGALMEAAEKLGRIHEIERLIRHEAAGLARCLPTGTSLFVNLHPLGLEDPEILTDNPLTEHAPRVIFEITERAHLEKGSGGWDTIRQLRARGHRVAIDDLGAGYAGLTSLVTLQPEIVKLDMELIRDVNASPARSALVSSLVGLCKQLNIEVVAEGVESDAESEHLVSLGCDWMQGYRFARPAPPFPTVVWERAA